MPTVAHLNTRYDDKTFKKEIIRVFGSLNLFCAVTDLDQKLVNRVVNCRPCTKKDINTVLEKWSNFDHELIDNRVESILVSKNPTTEDIKWLYDIYLDYRIAIANLDD